MTSLSESRRRAAVVGTGLIGGSIGLALRKQGWHVTGRDLDAERAAQALEQGAVDAIGEDPAAEITFVCVPVSSIAEAARGALASGGVVTDVFIDAPRAAERSPDAVAADARSALDQAAHT